MVDPARIAQILNKLHALGSIRRSPTPDDLAGEFDGWFDGGAFWTVTGSVNYVFADRTEAVVNINPWLSVAIKFADGTEVEVIERSRDLAQDVCLRCGGAVAPGITHQVIDGRPCHIVCPG